MRSASQAEMREQEYLDAALEEANKAVETVQRKNKKIAARKSRTKSPEGSIEAKEKLQAARDFVQKAGLSPRSPARRQESESEEISFTTFHV